MTARSGWRRWSLLACRWRRRLASSRSCASVKAELDARSSSPTRRAGGRVRAAVQVRVPAGLSPPVERAARPVADPDDARLRYRPPASAPSRSCFRRPTDFIVAGHQRAARRSSSASSRSACSSTVAPGRRRRGRSTSRRVCAIRPATTSCASRRSTVDVRWTLDGRRRAGAGATRAAGRCLRAASRSARARRRRRRRRSPRATSSTGAGRRSAGRRRRRSTTFAMVATTGGYHEQRRLPDVHPQRRNTASRSAGLFEGRGPLAILLLVLARRPRAQPDAVRAADDSDQPGDHRRRRQGRRRGRAASCSAASTARRWRWSTACSASSSS